MEDRMITTKHVYDGITREDGVCFLVDRLWPRGMKKERLEGVTWLKELGPSTELRHWFDHDEAKWAEFKTRYYAELDEKKDVLAPIIEANRAGNVTLLFATKELKHNNAVALKEYLEQ